MGPNSIEDDSENIAPKLREKIKEKGKRDNRPQKSNVKKEIKHTTDHWVGQRINIQHGILSNRCTSNI